MAMQLSLEHDSGHLELAELSLEGTILHRSPGHSAFWNKVLSTNLS